MAVVALFGTSANPPTGESGHAGIVRWVLEHPGFESLTGAQVEQLCVLPVYRHAFAEKAEMLAFEHRLALAKLAFEQLPGLQGRSSVLALEKEVVGALHSRGESAGTIDVVRRLTSEHPEHRFALVLGADTYQDLQGGRWKEGEALQQLVDVLVLPRKGQKKPKQAVGEPEALSDISSTAVRKSRDLDFLKRALQPQVLDYLQKHQLYAFAPGISP